MDDLWWPFRFFKSTWPQTDSFTLSHLPHPTTQGPRSVVGFPAKPYLVLLAPALLIRLASRLSSSSFLLTGWSHRQVRATERGANHPIQSVEKRTASPDCLILSQREQPQVHLTVCCPACQPDLWGLVRDPRCRILQLIASTAPVPAFHSRLETERRQEHDGAGRRLAYQCLTAEPTFCSIWASCSSLLPNHDLVRSCKIRSNSLNETSLICLQTPRCHLTPLPETLIQRPSTAVRRSRAASRLWDTPHWTRPQRPLFNPDAGTAYIETRRDLSSAHHHSRQVLYLHESGPV